jgi:SAM-dependent methyltransferase
MKMKNFKSSRLASIKSFGDQWTRFNDLGPVAVGPDANQWFRQWLGTFDPECLRNCRVAEIGAGVGRSLYNMARFGPAELIGYEPSECFPFLKENMREVSNCRLVNKGGHEFQESNLDFVLSIGVIHHIPDPLQVIRNAYQSLRPGGQLVIWVYGNQLWLYVWCQKLARRLTMRMSDNALNRVSGFIALILTGYARSIAKVRARRAPMYDYLTTTFVKVSREFRKIVVFDQLNPGWSDYYSEEQLRQLLVEGGFSLVQIEEKGGYSWTAICTR